MKIMATAYICMIRLHGHIISFLMPIKRQSLHDLALNKWARVKMNRMLFILRIDGCNIELYGPKVIPMLSLLAGKLSAITLTFLHKFRHIFQLMPSFCFHLPAAFRPQYVSSSLSLGTKQICICAQVLKPTPHLKVAYS